MIAYVGWDVIPLTALKEGAKAIRAAQRRIIGCLMELKVTNERRGHARSYSEVLEVIVLMVVEIVVV